MAGDLMSPRVKKKNRTRISLDILPQVCECNEIIDLPGRLFWPSSSRSPKGPSAETVRLTYAVGRTGGTHSTLGTAAGSLEPPSTLYAPMATDWSLEGGGTESEGG
jgi:hypothetical protein